MFIIRRTPITHLLLLGLFLAYLALWSLPPDERAQIVLQYAAGRSLDHTVVVATFIHLGPAHLLVNLGGIWLFGVWVEYRLSFRWYVLVLLWSGLGSWLYLILRRPDQPAVGASGLLAGVAGASLGLLSRRWLAMGLTAGLIWLGVALLLPSPGSNDVHAAGLLAGCGAGWLLREKTIRPVPPADRRG